ncbi:MAG: aminoacyl-tRNA hydrolase [Planctomycetota bacterium]|jgi:PTH1 family peptidyl-tRNA hydrolase
MRIVLGIGNPGRKYEGTRHNIGFRVVDALCEKQGKKLRKMGFEFAGARARLGGEEAVLVKTWTYVNKTGNVVPELRKKYEVTDEGLLVVCDDFALPLGSLRMRPGGSSGGHNGLRSLIEALGTEQFPRLRVGIGSPRSDAVDHVLAKFSKAEREVVDRTIADALEAVECWAAEGIQAAMSRFNRTPKEPEDESEDSG